MKAWIKGGLIGGGIGVLLLIISITSPSLINSGFFGFGRVFQIVAYPLMMPIYYLLTTLSPCKGEECMGGAILSTLLSLILTLFIIGALVGFVVGKIKEKKNENVA